MVTKSSNVVGMPSPSLYRMAQLSRYSVFLMAIRAFLGTLWKWNLSMSRLLGMGLGEASHWTRSSKGGPMTASPLWYSASSTRGMNEIPLRYACSRFLPSDQVTVRE
ncbi:MAG: hypothetical protein A4E29_01339 [Methanomassiliicoccales archaeon PtaB.Bin134]|nr:MAG: hypothetical protein A4E29_01339 [Methanomassiliicoccales archaeon PtaB.Bin134]